MDSSKQVRSVVALLASALVFGLSLFWIRLHEDAARGNVSALVYNVIPSVLAALIAFVAVYFFLERLGIRTSVEDLQAAAARGAREAAPDQLIEFRKALKEELSGVRGNGGPLVEFFESYRDVPWKRILATATSLDIYACYYDSWMNANAEELVAFFRRGGKARVIVADPDNEIAFKTTCDRFPEYTADVIKGKILNTGARLHQCYRDAGSSSASVESFLYPGLVSFSLNFINGSHVLLGVFEHDRHGKIDSPAILLDLTKSERLQKFFNKELAHILKKSRRVAL